MSEKPSFFDKPLCNHVPNRYGSFSLDGAKAIGFNWVFSKGPPHHGITGLSEFAEYTSDGKKAPKVNAPFAWIIDGTDEIKKKCEKESIVGQNYGCFDKIKAGTKIWNVWVHMEPVPSNEKVDPKNVHYLGTVDSVTDWTTTKFGDETLYFKHQFWPDELKMRTDKREKWEPMVTTDEGGFMDLEGPEKYHPYLKVPDRKSVV